VLSATIDFRPGNAQNLINPRKQGSTWVAVLSEGTFDALQVIPRSSRLGRGRAPPGLFSVKDANRDGLPDLMLRFWTPRMGIRCGDARIRLTAKTWAGDRVVATDAIRTIGCKPQGGGKPATGGGPGSAPPAAGPGTPDVPDGGGKPGKGKPDKGGKPGKGGKPDKGAKPGKPGKGPGNNGR
jgi:hypothetical protein